MWAILIKKPHNRSEYQRVRMISVEKITPKCIFSAGGFYGGNRYLKRGYRIDVFEDKDDATTQFHRLKETLGLDHAEAKRLEYRMADENADKLVQSYALKEPSSPCPKIYTKPTKQEN